MTHPSPTDPSPTMRRTAPLLMLTAFVATCVLPGVGVGATCEATSDCISPNVCVLLDETDPDSGSVCLPMLDLEAPQPCFADEDCSVAGWPVDTICNDEGLCTCEGEGFACNGVDEVLGEHTCRCLATATLDDECEDDNQCDTLICGDGTCTLGFDGDPCDTDADCQSSVSFTCEANACI